VGPAFQHRNVDELVGRDRLGRQDDNGLDRRRHRTRLNTGVFSERKNRGRSAAAMRIVDEALPGLAGRTTAQGSPGELFNPDALSEDLAASTVGRATSPTRPGTGELPELFLKGGALVLMTGCEAVDLGLDMVAQFCEPGRVSDGFGRPCFHRAYLREKATRGEVGPLAGRRGGRGIMTPRH
jgi:hypothetical protein